uniref:Uncharacterized protein n=1 Tax=Glossina austeni TaxID=7395 RepID=A0A1A9VDD9_GLOAU
MILKSYTAQLKESGKQNKKRSFEVPSYAKRCRFSLCKLLRTFGILVPSLSLRCVRIFIEYYRLQMPAIELKLGFVFDTVSTFHRHHYHQLFTKAILLITSVIFGTFISIKSYTDMILRISCVIIHIVIIVAVFTLLITTGLSATLQRQELSVFDGFLEKRNEKAVHYSVRFKMLAFSEPQHQSVIVKASQEYKRENNYKKKTIKSKATVQEQARHSGTTNEGKKIEFHT